MMPKLVADVVTLKKAPPVIELPPNYSEEELASEFTRLHAGTWRYVAEQSKWYWWNERRWQLDRTLHAFDLARGVARDVAARALVDEGLKPSERARVATAICSKKTIAAIESLAHAAREHAMVARAWDSHPWLLNTCSGVLDLKTGKTTKPAAELLMTKLTGSGLGGECPIWRAFIDRVTGGDRELAAFLQRFAGYCMTGDTSEHALLFLWGLGGNGKSTFANALMGALGDYATTAPTETFVESFTDRHPTDLAMLSGARLVVVQEVEDGQRWASSKIKMLTGGDTVRARFMRSDFFEYVPQFKLLFCGNHKPAFRTVDEAIRRRFHLVPFTETIAPAERDPDLPKKLRAEWSGILLWALDGCLQWQDTGLAPPDSVRAATEAYLQDEDVLLAWLHEGCERKAESFSTVKELYRSYHDWAAAAGEKFYGSKRFSQILDDHGFARCRAPGTRDRGFAGIRVKQVQGSLDGDL